MNAYVRDGDADAISEAVSRAWDGLEEPTRFLWEFQETVQRLDEKKHGFAMMDLAEVEACRGCIDGNFFWDGSFLVRLKDGRRAQLISACDAGGDWEKTGRIEVAMVAADSESRAPRLADEASSFRWQDAPRLNDFLHALQAELTGQKT